MLLVLKIVIVLYICIAGSSTVSTNVTLTAAKNYVIYSGDLEVSFSIARGLNITSGFIELLLLTKQIRITTFPVPPGLTDGSMSVRCGVVDVAGEFIFRYTGRLQNAVIIQSQTTAITSKWPAAVTLAFPPFHEALTSDLLLRLAVRTDILHCESVQQGSYYALQLVSFGRSNLDSHFKTMNIIDTKKFVSLSAIGSGVLYQCGLIDQAGLYQAILTSSQDNDHQVAVSNIIHVAWSKLYSLALTGLVETIFPCSGEFAVGYTQPSCSRNEDKVRLYKQKSHAASELHYMTERRAQVGHSRVYFGCHLFNSTEFAYCFKYISTANNGAVNEQSNMCIPNDAYTDADWNEWTEWTHCVPTQICGRGQRIRHRVCDSQPPTTNTSLCNGNAVEYAACSTDCQVMPVNPPSLTVQEDCLCGCVMTKLHGYIVALSSSHCPLSRVWTIILPDANIVHLSLMQLTVPILHQFRAHDGQTTLSNLLALYDGPLILDNITLISSHNILRIVLKDQNSSTNSGIGFTAFYNGLVVNDTNIDLFSHHDQGTTLQLNHVTVPVSIVCTVVVLVSISILYIYQKYLKQLRQSSKKLMSTPAHESLLALHDDINQSHHKHVNKLNSMAQQREVEATDDSAEFGSVCANVVKLESQRIIGNCSAGRCNEIECNAAPIADDEDLSPSSQCILSMTAVTQKLICNKICEQIPLQPYNKDFYQHAAETSKKLEQRPPVEGRDSFSPDDDKIQYKGLLTANYIPPTIMVAANIRDLRDSESLSQQRAPSDRSGLADLHSPASSEQLHILTSKQLFSDRASSPESDIVTDEGDDELEYDDYMTQLPGSYFTMDPQAYTLTWSKQPSRIDQQLMSTTESQLDRPTDLEELHY